MGQRTRQSIHNKFTGVNNVLPPERLPHQALRGAVNVDIDQTGRPRRRKGFTSVQTGVNVRSLWSNGTTMLYAEGNELKDFGTGATIRSDLQVDSRVSYAEVAAQVFYTDGKINGIYALGGINRPWGIPVPPPPVVSSSSGAYPAGDYQFVITHVDAFGRESGASLVAKKTTTQASFFRVSWPASSYTTRVYLSTGSVFYQVVDVLPSVSSVNLSGVTGTAPLRTQFLNPAPVGQLVDYHYGRLYVASGSNLWYSEPGSLEHFRLATNFLSFESDITLVGSALNGLFVCAGKTYWLAGTDPSSMTRIEKASYPAILGTMVRAPSDLIGPGGEGFGEALFWASTQGICLGAQDGLFRNLTERSLSYAPGDVGAGLFRREEGMNQYVGLIKNSGQSDTGLYATDTAVATVVRNGIVI